MFVYILDLQLINNGIERSPSGLKDELKDQSLSTQTHADGESNEVLQ